MNHISLFTIKKDSLKNLFTRRVIKNAIGLALLLPLSLCYSCSDDDDPDIFPDTSITKSISKRIEEGNQNMPSGGTIIAQYADSPSESDITKLVDNDAKTKFVTYHTSFDITWEGDHSLIVYYYTLTSADDSPQKDPKSWSLYGSSNNKSWTLIDKQSNQTFSSRGEQKGYRFGNETAYKYYKLNIESNNGDSSTEIAEWSMQGYESIDDLIPLMDGDTHDDSTPMGIHYANKHVTTDEDREWLNTPGSWHPVIRDLHWKEFDVNLYPFGIPQPADANQRGIGDCCAIAIFGSMAYMYPEFIKTLIKDNGNKTYTVSMFDPQAKPVKVTIDSKFLADNGGTVISAYGKHDVITWASVLEKALMKYNSIYDIVGSIDIGGIGSEFVTPPFTGTGESRGYGAGRVNAEDLTRTIKASLIQGKIMTGGFGKGNIPIGDGTETISGHAFSIMFTADPTALFSMRNPWGFEAKDGVSNIPNYKTITDLIDIRIIEPGIAAKTGYGRFTPYIPPQF